MGAVQLDLLLSWCMAGVRLEAKNSAQNNFMDDSQNLGHLLASS